MVAGNGVLKNQVAVFELDQLGAIFAVALAVGLQVEIELTLAGGAVVGKADGLVKGELDINALALAHAHAVEPPCIARAVCAVLDVRKLGGADVAECHHEILGIGAAAGAGAGFKIGPREGAVAELQAAIVVLIVNGVEAVGIVALDSAEVADAGIGPRLVAPAVDHPRAAAEGGVDLFRHRHLGRIGLDLLPVVVAVGVGAVIEGGGGVELQIVGDLRQLFEHRGGFAEVKVPSLTLVVSRDAVAVLCLLAVTLALV